MLRAPRAHVEEKPPKPEVVRKPPTPLKQGWVQETSTKPLYPKGSVQGKVEKPGPFICPFNEASENGFVDGVDGWKDRQKREEQALDRELVAQGRALGWEAVGGRFRELLHRSLAPIR